MTTAEYKQLNPHHADLEGEALWNAMEDFMRNNMKANNQPPVTVNVTAANHLGSAEEEMERVYVFRYRTGEGENDVRREEVPESELTHEQVQQLTMQLHQYYHSMPDIVKDQFVRLVAIELDEEETKHRENTILTAEDIRKMEGEDGGLIKIIGS